VLGNRFQQAHAPHALPFVGLQPEGQQGAGGQRLGVTEPDAVDRLALVASTDFLARSFTWPAPILATVRGLGLGAVQSLGPVKRLLARTMMFGVR